MTWIPAATIRVVPIILVPAGAADPRRRFWNAAVAESGRVSPGSSVMSEDEAENLLRQRLGDHLRISLGRYFFPVHERSSSDDDAVPVQRSKTSDPRAESLRLANLVSFRVSSITYGSLDFTLEVAGIKALAQLFTGDVDLFIGFLSSYLPIAFQNMFEVGDVVHLRFDALSTPALTQAFSENSPTPQSKRFDRSQLMWLLANGTLVVPVLLSLLVMYVALKALSEHSDQLNRLLDGARAREIALLEREGRRISELEHSD